VSTPGRSQALIPQRAARSAQGRPVSDETEALQAALTALLPRLLPGCHGVDGLQRLSAGATLQTWAFDAVGAGAPQPLILRRSPGGLRGAESLALADEAALLRALAAVSPALRPVLAEVLHVATPADGLGDGFLMRRVAGETIPRHELVTGDPEVGERTIDVQINRLRRKIERDPANPVWLQTVRGIGYRLSVE